MNNEVPENESKNEHGGRLRRLRAVKPTKSGVAGVLLATVVVVSTVMSVVNLREHQTAERQRGSDAEILDAARSGVLAMVSISDTTAGEDIDKVLDQSTGTFRKDFEARSQSFVSVVQEAKVVTTGDVVAQGIESRDDESASVLVYATSKVTNAAGAQEESRTWRLRVTMADDNGRYKMSNVEFVA